MQNTLLKWFLYWLGGMVLLMLLYGFFGPKGASIDLGEVNFSTTQSSELYFKNMRSYFYDQEQHKESNYTIYRIDSREEESKLNFMILHNWLMSEAYIMAESDQIDLVEEEIIIYFEEGERLILSNKDAESNYVFAANFYAKLTAEEIGSMQIGEESIPFSESEQKSLKRNLKDYFKLVGKLR